MGYELEIPTWEEYAATADLRFLERVWAESHRRLAEAVSRTRTLKGLVENDDPVWLAAQIRVAEARQRCREATDALTELTLEAV
jgi:hypothetical protein